MDGTVIERIAHPGRISTLARLGVFGMKIPREYGGLGLGQVGFNQALMLIGSVHPSLGALVSAHQSIGVPEPVKMFGTEEQKLPPPLRRWRCHGVPADRARASVPTRPGWPPRRLRSTAQRTSLNGLKLDQRRNRRTGRRHGQGARTRARSRRDHRLRRRVGLAGITVERRNAFMGLKGIENGLTRFDKVRVPAANRLAREGDGAQDRTDDAEHRPALDSGVVHGRLEVECQDRP